MIDLAWLRQNEAEGVARLAKRLGSEEAAGRIQALLATDARVRQGAGRVDEMRAERNRLTDAISQAKRQRQEARGLVEEVRALKERLQEAEAQLQEAEREREHLWLRIPNLPLHEVPEGGEEANREVRQWGEPATFTFPARPHWELGEELGILDLAAGARVAGSGFPLLKGLGARLERGLVQWMMELHALEHGYTEMAPPFLVHQDSMRGTGQYPKFVEDEDAYEVPGDGLYLIPTSEVPVVNVHRQEVLAPGRLPLAYVAQSPCFRREAGAAGKDTRGLLRVHQFTKVELVRFERPEAAEGALEEMVRQATTVLERLGLCYRVLLLAAGDTGFASARTYDIEVWAPGVGRWLEVSSASNCTDFQARRADIRYRPEGGGKLEFVHTLNASGLALPRLMVALLESYQREDGSVALPEVLWPYLKVEEIRKD